MHVRVYMCVYLKGRLVNRMHLCIKFRCRETR